MLLYFAGTAAYSQELEPRRWSHLPVGVNFAAAGYAYTSGNIFLDPAILVEDAEAEIHTVGVGYARALDFFGKTGRIDVKVPVSIGRWQGLLDGEPASTRREGFGDPRVRFAVNLLGSPAQSRQEFARFVPRTIVGTAVDVTLPLGQYEKERLINLGSNRWVVRPQLGVVHNVGKWAFELTGSAWFFGENRDYQGESDLKQDPLYALQTHVIHTFRPGLWVSLSAAFGSGARPRINDIPSANEQGNFLWAASFGFSPSRSHGFKLAWQSGRTTEEVGVDYDRMILAYAFMWGGR